MLTRLPLMAWPQFNRRCGRHHSFARASRASSWETLYGSISRICSVCCSPAAHLAGFTGMGKEHVICLMAQARPPENQCGDCGTAALGQRMHQPLPVRRSSFFTPVKRLFRRVAPNRCLQANTDRPANWASCSDNLHEPAEHPVVVLPFRQCSSYPQPRRRSACPAPQAEAGGRVC